jgi:hypothetical protein
MASCAGPAPRTSAPRRLEDNQEVFAAGPCAQAFATAKPAVMRDATLERRWDEIALTFIEVHVRSG